MYLCTYVFSVRIKRPVAILCRLGAMEGARQVKMGRENNRLKWPLSLLFFAMSKVDWQHVANFPSLEEAENYLSSQNVRKQRISKLKASKKVTFYCRHYHAQHCYFQFCLFWALDSALVAFTYISYNAICNL